MTAHPRAEDLFVQLAREWSSAWRRFAGDRSASPEVDVQRARTILSFVIGVHLDAPEDLSTVLLLHALQELGEGYALASMSPDEDLPERLAFPRLDVVLATVKASGYPDALNVLGQPSADAATPDSTRATPSSWHLMPEDPHERAQVVSQGLEGYMQFCQILAHPGGRREMALRRRVLRTNACRSMSRLRWQFSALGNTAETAESVERRAVQLVLLLADCEYLMTTLAEEESTTAVNVLPVDFVREYTWGTGIATWVGSHGVWLPHELASR